MNPDCPGALRRAACVLILLGGLLVGITSPSRAQGPPGTKPEPASGPEATAAVKAAKAAAEARAAEALAKAQAEALAELLGEETGTAAKQAANLGKWIPHTYERLRARGAVHIVAIGDSVTRYMSYDENRENSHYAFHGVFAAKLADEFFYTGGVRDISPTRGHEAKMEPVLGPELTLENVGMNGRLSLHALSRITADGLVNQPDLVLINFGVNDALASIGLATYVEALERSVKLVKSTGADVILLGPTTILRHRDLRDGALGDGTLAELAQTRPYSGAMEELAARLGVFYFDLGSVTTSTPGTTPGSSPEQALASIAGAGEKMYFEHGAEKADGLHPNPAAHQMLGRAIFKALRDGSEEPPYRLGGVLNLDGAGKATLEFKMKNLRDAPASGQLLLMPVAGMLPQSTAVPFDLAAGKGKVFRVSYQSVAGGTYDFPADAPRVFVPMLVSDARRSYSPVFAAALTPVGVVWDTGAEDLSRSTFEVKCEVVAGGAAPASGSYEARWNGQTTRGEFKLQPAGRQTLALKFALPVTGAQFSVRDRLVLSLTLDGGKAMSFVRDLEASRNLGLGESVDMMHPDKYAKGEPASDPRVRFMAQATPGQLVLNFDVEDIPLEGEDPPAPLILEFQLDARGYGKRRKFGYVDFVRVKFRADGTAERLSALKPAVFGDWYDRTLDRTALGATHTQLADGRVRYAVTIPRSYLYLHEFALGNGNSVLGVNASLMFAKAGQPTNPYPPERRFELVSSGLDRHSAESLTVLELVQSSSGRWSVRLN